MNPRITIASLVAVIAASLPTQTNAQSLSEIGDIGKVIDTQGIVSVRPKMAKRWSMASKNFPLKPGDWVRTDVRGANAVQLRLAGGGQLILGPGTLVEIIDKMKVSFFSGELEASARKKSGQIVIIPTNGKSMGVSAGQRKLLRRNDGRGFQVIEKDPNWLLGFKGAVTTESMGSLLATVEGRNTPLTIGYHKVTVDIRDQIARTTIEESFVNHTESRLEGVFYFPLPQDASISGFGMWIGGELVEADVVEKQRAREIYETILRERRDPGLLEWTGGNIFKARVFPILGHSEKRIKITYTQVLPMRRGKVRFSYALQSEMLRQNPLRELSINVRVNSAIPIDSFVCSTHSARISKTANSAQAEFSAQEYTPDRDFEVDIGLDSNASPVVMVPHRRGEDGYFLALVDPPGGDGNWDREIIPDGDQINLVIVADTSGSMNETARENQDALIAALTGSMGGKDTISIATSDIEPRWFEPEKFICTREEHASEARAWIARRLSLGWSDLDKTFASVMKKIGGWTESNIHVVYIGDGVITSGDGDPVAFANRLKRLYKGQSATFHAISPSSSFEPGVMKAIASLGGGSVRRIGGSDTPAAVAHALLAEISEPGLRDMKVEFSGVRVARVYPEELPNGAAGSQQIIIGRYLPEGDHQKGEIIVSGMRDGKAVTFRTPITLADAEHGNSFIPRLWARMHLDVLLEQGRTPEIKSEVIALSEEYKIMTPYTSFLVLESDADRERFKVKKRFEMRDGERFFAEGRDNANYELLQKQMKLAGTWRLNLRRGFLRELTRLGRGALAHQPGLQTHGERPGMGFGDGFGGGGFRYSGNNIVTASNRSGDTAVTRNNIDAILNNPTSATAPPSDEYAFDFRTSDLYTAEGFKNLGLYDDAIREYQKALQVDPYNSAARRGMEGIHQLKSDHYRSAYDEARAPMLAEVDKAWEMAAGESMDGFLRSHGQSKPSNQAEYRESRVSKRAQGYYLGWENGALLADKAKSLGPGRIQQGGWHWRRYMSDLESLFPASGADGLRIPDRSKQDPPHQWPKVALELADSLLRLEAIAALRDGGVRLTQNIERRNVRRDVIDSLGKMDALLSGDSWSVLVSGDRQDSRLNWWKENGERVTRSHALGLGRIRKAETKRDRFAFSIHNQDASFTSLADTYGHMKPKIARDGDRATLTLTGGNQPDVKVVIVIDTMRRVVLSITNHRKDKVTGSITFGEFVEAGESWWARKIESKNADGKVAQIISRKLKKLDADAFEKAYGKSIAGRDAVILIRDGLPIMENAKQAGADGKKSFESEFALLKHFAQSQQWERVTEHFEAMRGFEGRKQGFRWLDIRLHAMKRRNEESREMVFKIARELAAKRGAHDLFLAGHLRGASQRVAGTNEQLDFLDIVKPIHERAAAHVLAVKDWKQNMVNTLQSAGRRPEAIALQKEIAEQYSWEANAQTTYANLLSYEGRYNEAIGWMDKMLADPERWMDHEISSFRMTKVNFLENQGDVAAVLAFVKEWREDKDDNSFQHQRYVSALIRTGKNDEAYDLIDQWLADGVGVKGEDVDKATLARLAAAIAVLRGQSRGVQRNDIPERFHKPLAKVVRVLALDDTHHIHANNIMSDYRFHRTETVRTLRRHFAEVLEKRAAKLDLVKVSRLFSWIRTNDPAVENDTWESIANALIKRWEKQKETAKRDQFSSTIANLLSGYVGTDRYLDFLRRQLKESAENDHGRYANQLFNAILNQSWTNALEGEAFDLLYRIDPNAVDETHLVGVRAQALVRLNDWVLRSGFDVAWAAVQGKEELSRTESRAMRTEFLKSAREGLAKRLGKELETRDQLTDWLNIERLYLAIVLKEEPAPVVAECWEYLGKHDPLELPEEKVLPWHEVVLLGRYLSTLEYLAARSKADPMIAKRLLEWFDTGIEKLPDSEAWQFHKYRLLVALDRPKDLKSALESWTKPADASNRWRLTLGYLHAELNELDDAIRAFEAIEKADELGPREYRTLADWYLVKDRREKRDEAILGYYGVMDEWRISNLISQHTNQIRNGFNNGTPEDFDPAVVDMFKAIFKKSPNPNNYTNQLGTLFRYTKDFRLLECVPEGILGNSAQQIYPFLGSMDHVLRYVQDEATTDQIFEHLTKVRPRAETPIDKRGFDLLEMLVHRKASEVLNQPGQHVPLALAAMQRAFKGDWGTGERRLMADFLSGLGKISQEPLAKEQLRELAELYNGEKPATTDRLHIGTRWASTERSYGHSGRGIEILESALDEYIDGNGGMLTQAAQSAFDQLVGYYESDRKFARGEKRIFAALEKDVIEATRHWLVERKYRLYKQTIYGKGTVSLGQGVELYRNVTRQLTGELKTHSNNHRYQLCSILIETYRTAHNHAKNRSAKDDVVEFGYGAFDEMVSFSTTNYQNLVSNLASIIRELNNYHSGLAFLIERYEREPEWLRVSGKGGWRRYGSSIASYRHHAKKPLGDLEPRLLKIVLAELRRDLEMQNYTSRSIYHDNYSHFWNAKRGDFLRVAEEVLKKRTKSLVSVRHIADYLFEGLNAQQRAVDVLVRAHGDGILDEGAISRLAQFMERMGQYAKAVPYLREIVGMSPGNTDYRRRLVEDLGRSGQHELAIAALDEAISWFKEHKTWNETAIVSLALGCHNGRLWERSSELYDEVIALHQRTQPNRGIGNGVLSGYYRHLSECHANLGNTAKAVDAAAGAIVSWGPTHGNRADALNKLRAVLEKSPDFDAYVAMLDKQVEESGLENPIVRKAIGQVYAKKKQHTKAIQNLRLAVETQPNDTETHQALVAAYDASGDDEGAVAQLIASIRLSTRSIALLRDLGARYQKLQREADAERARTGIIEALPNESESHAMLGEIRQKQNRWEEAAGHWKQVADIRTLEPTGLQKLADAQIKLGQKQAAVESLAKLLAKEWPSRFGNVHRDARKKLGNLEKKAG